MTDHSLQLGPFRLETAIGKGGMGTVWQARHVAQDVRVAIKVLASEVAQDPTLLAAFRNEVRAVAALHHPNVVMVLDHGEIPPAVQQATDNLLTAGSPYLVMEYADHGCLSPLRGKLPWIRVKQILLALLDALAHAHARGVVHRDLKPANVLLTGRNLRVKLTDFGLVHLTQYARLENRVGDEDEPLEAGTPPYMAPEQLQGEWRDSGPWTDLFSLGNLAWSMVCGGAPLTGMPLPVVYYRIISRRLPAFEPLIQVPDGFEEWIMRLIEPDPADRYQRAADAAWALMQLPDEVLRLPGQEDEPTIVLSDAEFPWEPPTLDALATLTVRRDLVASLLAELPGPAAIPPLPETWRRSGAEPASMRLLGAGLGLFGLRTVPFVGREEQRDAIWSALHAVRRGEGPRVVLLRGPPGVGKTRLCAWITHRAHEVGSATILSARHDREGGAEHGLAPMLLRWHQAADLPREDLEKRLSEVLGRHGVDDPLETEALLEYLAPALRDDRSTAALPSLAARHAVFARHLQRLAHERSGAVRPIVLVLDDIQWGTETLAFLDWLLQRADELQLPVLALGILYDQELAGLRFEERLLQQIREQDRTTLLELGPLGEDHARELVQQLVGLDIELADLVAERAQGNPLFAVQLIGDWVRRGVLVAGPRGFVVREGEAIPEDLQDVWAQRVDQVLGELSAHDMVALEVAAVLGMSVSAREWEAACAEAGVPADPHVVDRLVERRLGRYDEAGWSFVHGMFRDAVLSRATDRQKELHAACLAALRAVWPEGTPGLERRLAHHAHGAGHAEASATFWLNGAREALDRGDATTAEDLCERADTSLDELGVADDDLRRLQSLCLRSEALREQGAYEASLHFALRAQELAIRAPHFSVIADALASRGHTARQRGELTECRRLLREAVDLYVGLRRPLGLAECLLALGSVSRQLGDGEDAVSLLGRAHDLFSRCEAEHGCARAEVELGIVELMRGQSERARGRLRDARRRFQRLGSREGLGLVANLLGLAALRSGDLATAESQLSKARERLAQADSPRVVLADVNLGRLAFERGAPAEAATRWQDALAVLETLGWPLETAACHVDLLGTTRDWAAWDAHLAMATELLGLLQAFDHEIALSAERAGEAAVSAGHLTRARQAFALAHAQWTGVGRRLKALGVHRRLRTLDA